MSTQENSYYAGLNFLIVWRNKRMRETEEPFPPSDSFFASVVPLVRLGLKFPVCLVLVGCLLLLLVLLSPLYTTVLNSSARELNWSESDENEGPVPPL